MQACTALILRLQTRLRARGDEGASLVEYALLVALIAIVCIAAVLFLGQEGSQSFSRVGTSVANA